MDAYPMRNFYNCGCYVADDVPIISRCAIHNGWVVARTNFGVTNPRQLILGKHKQIKIVHHNLYDVLENLKRQTDLIFAYPEFNLFGVQHLLTDYGYASCRMEVFDHIQRLLKPEGKALLLVDPIDLGHVIYQALLRKFEVHTRYFPVYIKAEPLFTRSVEKCKVYKVAVGLNTGPLPKIRIDELGDVFDALDVPVDARIIDLSCIHIGEVKKARPKSKIVGICEDAKRYRRFCEVNS